MKKVFRFLMFGLLALTFAFPASAQDETDSESDEDSFLKDPQYQAMVKRRAAERVGQMNDYISSMVDEDEYDEDRPGYREAALTLFIGRGYEYMIGDVKSNGVKMESTSVGADGTVNKKSSLIRDYFQRLIDLVLKKKYVSVKIETTDIHDMEVSSIKKIGEGMYQCSVTFGQTFVGERKDFSSYKDWTQKTVTCYIEVEYSDEGVEYLVTLGDVKCGETHRL